MRALLIPLLALLGTSAVLADTSNSNPWVTQASGHEKDGHGLNWDVGVFKGQGVSDVFPKQIESDPLRSAFYVTGSWRGTVKLGEQTMTSIACVDSQECSFFVMKMAASPTGDAPQVMWARTLVQPSSNSTVLSQNSMDVGPDGGVVIDGQFCFGDIVVGDGDDSKLLSHDADPAKGQCLGFVAKFDPNGKLEWANRIGMNNRVMREGQLRVHSKTGDVFISGLLMGDDVQYGDATASSRRRTDGDVPPLGIFDDTALQYSHHFAVWAAKVDGGSGDVQWLQTLNTSNTQVTTPNMVLDESRDKLYLSLSTHDPPFYLHTSQNGRPVLADGFVVQLDTDGRMASRPFEVEAVQEQASPEQSDERDPVGHLSYLKYMTSVAAGDGAVFVSGVFYGTVRVQGRTIRSRSPRHEASFVAKLTEDGMQLEWLELLEATDNLSVQHIEMSDSSLYIVGWLVGEASFGNGVALSAVNGDTARSESFVLEMSQSTGRVRWAEKGSAEEFVDATFLPDTAGDGKAVLAVLGGFYWTAKLDQSDADAIFVPWSNGERSDVAGMVILTAVLDPSNISPVVTSDRGLIWYGPAEAAPALPGSWEGEGEGEGEDARPPGPVDNTRGVDYSPAAREDMLRTQRENQERLAAEAEAADLARVQAAAPPAGREDDSGPLSVLSIALIALAVLVGLLALAGTLGVVTVCVRKRSLQRMYTNWRYTAESLPGHSRTVSSMGSFFGGPSHATSAAPSAHHSRNPSDVVASLALVRMAHLPPSATEPASGPDPAQLSHILNGLEDKPKATGTSCSAAPDEVTIDLTAAPPQDK